MASRGTKSRRAVASGPPLPVSVVVPTRNVAQWVESCLAAIRANRPAEIVVVDGASTDGTVALAARYADVLVDDGGEGVSAARRMGFELTTQPWVAFIDADVLLEQDSLRRLLQEAQERDLDGIQAGLRSIGAGDYWSEALARHHNRGRSRRWFGVCATLIRREVMVEHPFDPAFRSGEDVDLRIRLLAGGRRVIVSKTVDVAHRFGSGFAFAREQWFADGAGLGRVVRKHGWSALPLAVIPFGASAIGLARVLVGEVLDVPYWIALALGNFLGLCSGLLDASVPIGPARRRSPRVVEARSAEQRIHLASAEDDPSAGVGRGQGSALPADSAGSMAALAGEGAGAEQAASTAGRVGSLRQTTARGPHGSNGTRGSIGTRGSNGTRGPNGSHEPKGGSGGIVVTHVDDRRVDDRPVVAEARSTRQAGEIRVLPVLGMLALSLGLIAIASVATVTGVVPGLGTFVASSPLPPVATLAVILLLVAAEIAGTADRTDLRAFGDRVMPALLVAAFVVFVVSGVRLAYIVGLLA